MAKDSSFYFSHDYNARNDEKILELRAEFGPEGYGIFWMIVETMAENENSGVKATLIGGLSLGFGVAKDKLCQIFTRCVELKLFYEEEGYYFSNRLLSHKEYRNKLSVAGKKGAKTKWAGHKGGFSTPYAKERKGKEIKEKEIKIKKGDSGFFLDLENGKVFFDAEKTIWQKLGKHQSELAEAGLLKAHDVKFEVIY